MRPVFFDKMYESLVNRDLEHKFHVTFKSTVESICDKYIDHVKQQPWYVQGAYTSEITLFHEFKTYYVNATNDMKPVFLNKMYALLIDKPTEYRPYIAFKITDTSATQTSAGELPVQLNEVQKDYLYDIDKLRKKISKLKKGHVLNIDTKRTLYEENASKKTYYNPKYKICVHKRFFTL